MEVGFLNSSLQQHVGSGKGATTRSPPQPSPTLPLHQWGVVNAFHPLNTRARPSLARLQRAMLELISLHLLYSTYLDVYKMYGQNTTLSK